MKGKQMVAVVGLIIGFLLLVEAVALIRLLLHVNTFAEYWQQQNNISEGEVLYIALGDSAAQGIGASHPEKGYVSLLAKALAENKNTTIKTANLSVSGAKIADVTNVQLPQLRQLGISNQTVVTLEVGANEMRSYNPEQFRKDMDELLKNLPAQTVVAEIPYFGGGRFRRFEKNVQRANGIIHELAAKQGLTVAPLYEVTKARDSLKVYAADLFHPSNTGYKNWADAFKQPLGL